MYLQPRRHPMLYSVGLLALPWRADNGKYGLVVKLIGSYQDGGFRMRGLLREVES